METTTTRQYLEDATTNPSLIELDWPFQFETSGEEFLQFELDHKTLAEVEDLAKASGCSRFEMCVTLLEEGVAQSCGVCVV